MVVINITKKIRPQYSGFVTIDDKRHYLNDNDIKLLILCNSKECHLSEISREIEIDVKNVSVRLDKLFDMKLIEVNSYGTNKRFVKTLNCKFCETKQENATLQE